MAHKVTFTVPALEIGKADIKFEVFYNGSKLGTLEISMGSLEWVSKNNSERRRIAWKAFDDLMRKEVPVR